MKQKKIGTTLYVFSEDPYVITEDTDANIIYIQEEVIFDFAKINIPLVSKMKPINYHPVCIKHPEWADYYNDFTVYVEQTTGGTVTAYPTSGDEGEEIQVSHLASERYDFDHWNIVDEDGNDIEVKNGKFLMPASNVTVSAVFIQTVFSITINDAEHGTVTSNKQTASIGETVTLTINPDSDYELDTLTVVDESSNPITVTNNQFIMPASNVTVSATFIINTYTISVGQTTNGSVTSNKQTASAGETVTLTINPDSGYELDTLTVVDESSNPITVTNNQFTMPESNVNVSATFIINYNTQYLTIESQVDNNTLSWKSSNASYVQDIQYSTDKSNWTTVTSTTSGATLSTLNNGDKLYLKGSLLGHNSFLYYESINSSGNFIVYGNIMSLTNGDNFVNTTTLINNFQLVSLFRSSKVTDASNLILPATTLTEHCYREMFKGCTSLITAPKLPATTLVNYCYMNIFGGCTSLVTAPELPATILVKSCYADMFGGCTSLTTAPVLPATTLAQYCYESMFSGCTSLTTAPELPATTLTQNCYSSMFRDCTSLNSITMLATDISASGCLNYWVNNVAATGTFTKAASMTTLPTGGSGIPSGWTVVDA